MQRCFKQRSHEEAGRAGQSTIKAKSVIYSMATGIVEEISCWLFL